MPGPRKATEPWPASWARPPSPPACTQTREGARYRRLARRLGKPKAQVAVGNTQLKVLHKLLSNPGMRHEDLGPHDYERRASLRRQIHHHVTHLESLGFEVTLCRTPDPQPGPAGQAHAV